MRSGQVRTRLSQVMSRPAKTGLVMSCQVRPGRANARSGLDMKQCKVRLSHSRLRFRQVRIGSGQVKTG